MWVYGRHVGWGGGGWGGGVGGGGGARVGSCDNGSLLPFPQRLGGLSVCQATVKKKEKKKKKKKKKKKERKESSVLKASQEMTV